MEKYTSVMIRDLLEELIGVATGASVTAAACGKQPLSQEFMLAVINDLLGLRTQATLILNRMRGWDYAVFDAFMMQEVKKHFEDRIHKDDET